MSSSRFVGSLLNNRTSTGYRIANNTQLRSEYSKLEAERNKANTDPNWKGILIDGQYYNKDNIKNLEGAALDKVILGSSKDFNYHRITEKRWRQPAAASLRTINSGYSYEDVIDEGGSDYGSVLGFTKKQYEDAKERQRIRDLFGKEANSILGEVGGGGNANANSNNGGNNNSGANKPISQITSPFLDGSFGRSNNAVGGGRVRDDDLRPLGFFASLGGKKRTLF